MLTAWYQLGISLLLNLIYFGYLCLYMECSEADYDGCELGYNYTLALFIVVTVSMLAIQSYLGLICGKFVE